jgi:hypothetical protein
MAVNYEETYMVEYTNDSISIVGAEGFKKLAVGNMAASTGDVSVTGKTGTIGGKATSALTVKPGTSISFGTGDHDLNGITVTAPATATAQVIGSKFTNIIS